MKKIALYMVLSLCVSLKADYNVRNYEIEPFIGFNNFDGDSRMENDTIFGIRGVYNLDKNYGFRLGYEGASDISYNSKYTTLASSSVDSKITDLNRFLAEIIVNGDEEYDVVPYIFLGLGYESLSDETDQDISQGLLDGGLGFKYQAWDNINLSLEAKGIRKFDTHDIDYTLSLGVGYLFGQSLTNPHVTQVQSTVEEITLPVIHKEETIVNDTVATDIQATSNIINEEYSSTDTSDDLTKIIDDTSIYENEMITAKDNNYYVQMAAWFENIQNVKLKNRLQKRNYEYDIIDTTRHGTGVKLLLVGPYETKNEAKIALKKLKKIKCDAFITKIK